MKSRGFTLIELLVVVAIIGILAAVGVVAYNGYTASAKVNASKSNHKNVVKFISTSIKKCDLGEELIMLIQQVCLKPGLGKDLMKQVEIYSSGLYTQDIINLGESNPYRERWEKKKNNIPHYLFLLTSFLHNTKNNNIKAGCKITNITIFASSYPMPVTPPITSKT